MPGQRENLDKENAPPAGGAGARAAPARGAGLATALGELTIGHAADEGEAKKATDGEAKPAEDPEVARVREENLRFIGEALEMARLALRTNETPVGCVLVHKGKMIAKGMNATNVTRNGTRHAELMAISALLSVASKVGPKATPLQPPVPSSSRTGGGASSRDGDYNDDQGAKGENKSLGSQAAKDAAKGQGGEAIDDAEKARRGHLYPYGQKLVDDVRVDPAVLRESVLYVTVEPCVMCASLLRQFGIKKVYFGAVNDKFGGTGGVFSIHANSLPVGADGQSSSAHPMPREPQTRLPDSSRTLGLSYPPGGGDGGNVEAGFEIEGGWGRDEAVALLRRFYVQENGRAPVPRKKEGRAARLAAMMEKDGDVAAGAEASAADGDADAEGEGEGEARDEGDELHEGEYLGVMRDSMRQGGMGI